jgi:hypothetical protein
MASDQWISKAPCPVCGGEVEVWYAFDDYGPAGGYSCKTDRSHEIPYAVAYPETENG